MNEYLIWVIYLGLNERIFNLSHLFLITRLYFEISPFLNFGFHFTKMNLIGFLVAQKKGTEINLHLRVLSNYSL